MPVFIRLIIIIIILISSLANIKAKEATKHAIKAELTVRLINHITWENEKSFSSFNIAFYGEEPDYFNSLIKTTKSRKIRRKPINLSQIDSITGLKNYHMLVIAEKTSLPFSQIALAARQTNTLVVSENQADQIYIMINFLHSEDNTYNFELNRPNILLEQLSISKDILLLGGTELDIAKLYREMEENFSTLMAKLNTTQKQSEIANKALARSQGQLSNTFNKLKSTQTTLKNANNILNEQEKTINVQEEMIKSRQSELEKVTTSADENKKLLKKQSKELTQRATQIQQQQEIVNEQQEKVQQNDDLLIAQQQQLRSQQSNIDAQKEQIKYQEILIIASFIATIVFLILIFWLYRINTERKKFSLELKKRGDELEDQVKARTAAAIKNEQHYRTLAELSPMGVYQIDTNGNCLYVNKRWSEYSGLSRNQALGQGWIKALHSNDHERLGKNWKNNLHKEKLVNSEHRYCTPDGQVRWLFGQCNAEFDTAGKLQGYIGAVADITEQKLLEEQLRRTQKMDALGKLTGGIAHDYNNMLTIISGYAELLENKLREQPDLNKYVKHIIHSSSRGAALTKKLLTFSKHTPADAKTENINALLEYQMQMLRKTLTPRIELNLVLEENLWPVWLDAGNLEDALVNMSINAMHAMDSGGNLTIKTKNLTLSKSDIPDMDIKPGEYVLLQLIDTGSGMDEETTEKIFDPFYSTKGAEGTGLGLSQVYSFVKGSEGGIKVTSKLNEGTTISIYFPRHKDTGSKEEIINTNAASSYGGHETILIVDDETALLELGSEILNAEGYEVFTADSGQKALQILQDTSIDLLLSDVIMPEMDGFQLVSKVQSLYPAIKVMLISGFSNQDNIRNSSSSLTKNIIQKPFDPKELLKRVRTLLDQK